MPLRRPGSHDLPVVALGVAVTVRCLGARAEELYGAVRSAWRDCLYAGSSDADLVVTATLDDSSPAGWEADARGEVWGDNLDVVLHNLSPAITTAAISSRAGELLMLHAAGLAHPRTGDCVALVAASGTGKTTVSTTLGRRLAYVSDETVAIGPDLRVVPYPKPLSVLEEPDSPLKRQVPASELGLHPVAGASRLSGILLLERDPAGPVLEVEEVSTVRAIAHLAPQISYLSRLERPLHRVAEAVDGAGGLLRVRYREAARLAELVHALVGQP